MINEKFEQYTYEYFMQLALSYVSDDKDKRQGSVVYDCLAPFCQLLAAGAMELRNFYNESCVLTATGEHLDNKVIEHNITRDSATYAVKKLTLVDENNEPVIVPMGFRLSTMSSTNPINYTVTKQYAENDVPVPGVYEATCEEVGTVGNEYSGEMVAITFARGLATATLSSLLVPARDEETDDSLRNRYLQAVNDNPFAGNIADYRSRVMDINGVGAVQIYPVWNGGGTVKLCILDTQRNVCSDEFISAVQKEVDPENYNGESGVGLGIAAIGHKVTVVTATEVDINVSASITLHNNYELSQVETSIKESIYSYIKSLRNSWDTDIGMNVYNCDVYRAKITAAIMGVTGVANVDVVGVLLNGKAEDIELQQTGEVQQLPKLGEVTLNV